MVKQYTRTVSYFHDFIQVISDYLVVKQNKNYNDEREREAKWQSHRHVYLVIV